MSTSAPRGLFFLALVGGIIAAIAWMASGPDEDAPGVETSRAPSSAETVAAEAPSLDAPTPADASEPLETGASSSQAPVSREEATVEEVVVRGRVESVVDGEPVPGGEVVVLAEPPAFVSLPLRSKTGWDGAVGPLEPFASAPVGADGTFVLHAPIRHGYLATAQPGVVNQAVVPVPPGGGELTLRVAPGGRVIGRVRTAEGTAVVGARVRLSEAIDPMKLARQGRRSRAARATTDGAGEFRFDQAPVGELLVKVTAKGRPETLVHALVTVGDTAEVSVVLTEGFELRGRVVTERGDGVPGARVKTRTSAVDIARAQRGEIGDHERDTMTGEDGRFAVRALPAGDYDVVVRTEAYAPGKVRHIAVPVAEGADELTIVLHGGLTIGGRVVDGDGDGVPRAAVGFYHGRGFFGMDLSAMMKPQDSEDLGGGWTYADDEGRFTSPALEAGTYDVVAGADGWTRGSLKEIATGTSGHLVTLEPNGSIHGIVLSRADGEPVTSYRLAVAHPFELLDMKSYIPSEVVYAENEDGTFVIDDVEAGDWTLQVAGERFGRAERAVRVVSGEATRGIIVLLPEEAKVRGVVVSRLTGEPIAGANVSTRSGMDLLRPDPLGKGDAVTDGGGRFELDELPAGRVQLSVQAKDFAPGSTGRLTLAEGTVLEDIVVQLDKGAVIRGTVTGADGSPIEGAILQAVLMGTVAPAVTHSDVDGKYVLTGLGPGTYTVTKIGGQIEVGSDDMLSSVLRGLATKTARVAKGEEIVLDFAGDAGGTVLFTGRVTEGGEPVASAIFVLTPDELLGEFEGQMRMTTTDGDGEFELKAMQPGEWTLTIQSGSPFGQSTKQSFDVSLPDEPTVRREYRLAVTGFEGQVTTDTLRRPIDKVRVAVDALDEGVKVDAVSQAAGSSRVADVFTDHEGRYRVRGLKPGRYRVTAGGSGMFGIGGVGGYGYRRSEPREVEVRDGELEPRIDFRLAPGGAVTGRAVDSEGRAVPAATIFFVKDGGEVRRHYGEVLSDESGKFRANGLDPDRYTMVAKASGFAPAIETGVRVREEEEIERDVTLQTGANLAVDVADGGDAPVVGASVRLFGPDGTDLTQFVTIGDAMSEVVLKGIPGRYQLGALEPGSYSLLAMWGGNSQTVELKHGAVDQVLTVTFP